MGILIIIFAIILFEKRIEKESYSNRLMIWGAVLFYLCFIVHLNWYLRRIGWTDGVSGSDLELFFDAAQTFKRNHDFSELQIIDNDFELSLFKIGYIAYIVFIAETALSPIFFSLYFSLHLVYFVQILAAITTALNIADFFNNNNIRVRNQVFWITILCASVMQMPGLLMRDIWILFFISCLLHEIGENDKSYLSLLKCLTYVIISGLLRSYSFIITVPIVVWYEFGKKRIALISSLSFTLLYFLGQSIIDQLAVLAKIPWKFGYQIDFGTLIAYILFPNPISQAYNITHVNNNLQLVFAGNTEYVYYMLSCWNVVVLPLSIYGFICGIKDGEKEEVVFWLLAIVNIAILVCIFYEGVSSPRHKLLIIISISYFLKKGLEHMKPSHLLQYLCVICCILIGIFFYEMRAVA